MLQTPPPVDVLGLFVPERQHLLGLLATLAPEAWQRETICVGWTVKDLVAHLLADDLGRLSRGRDGHRGVEPTPDEPLPAFIDRLNDEWVRAARRLSPSVLIDLLGGSGNEVVAWFRSLDLMATGAPVAWTGPEPAPIWLDVAREFTERWHHHQQIRDAVGVAPLDDPIFLGPVLATFARSLPVAMDGVEAREDTAVTLRITGPAGGDWSVVREAGRWDLKVGAPSTPHVLVELDQDTAWRRLTRVIDADAARARAKRSGDPAITARVLDAVAIIV